MKQISEELLDQLLKGYARPEDVSRSEGLLEKLQKAVMERSLKVELTDHLGSAQNDAAGFLAKHCHGDFNLRYILPYGQREVAKRTGSCRRAMGDRDLRLGCRNSRASCDALVRIDLEVIPW